MISGNSVIALVPARGGSRRLPGKNLKLLAGKPLIAWTIACASAVDGIDRILVSTDSAEIAAVARKYGADAPWLRPVALAADTASATDAILHALEECAARGEHFDVLVLLQPTSPFRDPALVRQAIELSLAAGGAPVVALGPAKPHPAWCFTVDADGLAHPLGDGSALQSRSQDLPAAYAVTGSIYVMGVDRYLREQSFFRPDTRALITKVLAHNIDIDDEMDWQVAEAVAGRMSSP